VLRFVLVAIFGALLLDAAPLLGQPLWRSAAVQFPDASLWSRRVRAEEWVAVKRSAMPPIPRPRAPRTRRIAGVVGGVLGGALIGYFATAAFCDACDDAAMAWVNALVGATAGGLIGFAATRQRDDGMEGDRPAPFPLAHVQSWEDGVTRATWISGTHSTDRAILNQCTDPFGWSPHRHSFVKRCND